MHQIFHCKNQKNHATVNSKWKKTYTTPSNLLRLINDNFDSTVKQQTFLVLKILKYWQQLDTVKM